MSVPNPGINQQFHDSKSYKVLLAGHVMTNALTVKGMVVNKSLVKFKVFNLAYSYSLFTFCQHDSDKHLLQ